MPTRRPHLLIVNASLAGDTGNTAAALADAAKRLRRQATVETLTLKNHLGLTAAPNARFSEGLAPLPATVRDALQRADGFLFGTGTHWDAWSSVLQKFLEDATPVEGTALWLGKPAAAVVTEHSVGGKQVLSRLQGVLVTLGCSLPPMTGLVISHAALIAAKYDPAAAQDFWGPNDLKVVCHNLAEAARLRRGGSRPKWRAWEVDHDHFQDRWMV